MRDFFSYIAKVKPKVIVNETSNSVELQNSIVKICRDRGICTVSHLDMYGEYTIRFKERPDYVVAHSEMGKRTLMILGFKESQVLVGGNPAFDRIFTKSYDKIVNRISPNIIYTSQCDEHTFDTVYRGVKRNFKDFTMDIKLHPEEKTYIYPTTDKRCRVLNYDNKGDFLTECLKYDLSIGRNSTLQLQTYLIGMPTVFTEYVNIDEGIRMYKAGENHEHPQAEFERDSLMKCVEIYENLRRKYKCEKH